MGAALDAALQVWDHENGSTLRMLRAIPEDRLDFRPHPKGWAVGPLAWHLVASERWFCTGAMGLEMPGADPVPKDRPPATASAMAAAREGSHAALAAAVRARGGAWLSGEVEFYGMRMTREHVVGLMVRHEIHHRGQLSMLLRIAGAKVPGVYGPSADEPG
jgi:uncharacterized damage-inducible protein DinB